LKTDIVWQVPTQKKWQDKAKLKPRMVDTPHNLKFTGACDFWT